MWNNVIDTAKPKLDKRLSKLTPVERHGGFLVKRDDLFEVAGIRGGKVRACWALSQGAKGLVTAGSRQSPQINIVAQIAKHLRIPCRAHTALGKLSSEVQKAKDDGTTIVQHYNGFSNVLAARARADAQKLGWTEIPFGMECEEAVQQLRPQLRNLPRKDFHRIIITVGSGMSLAGVLWGLSDLGWNIPVVGVRVGGGQDKSKFSPVLERRMDKYAPHDWRKVKFVHCGLHYDKFAPVTKLGDLELDPIYEAKCLPFLEKGDLFWVVGIRQTA
jgi:1-aminocyclopropane-1-carboxylate deaminase/D-cysteine desulfhydrase-like pyridoxal-dependent ACC family enzyme